MNNETRVALPIALALLGGTVLTTSDQTQLRLRVAHVTAFSPAGVALSAEDEAIAEENCPLGLPVKDPAWGHGPTTLLARRGYALEHSATDKIPLWVCEHVERPELEGSAIRRDNFAADPRLPAGGRAELSDYKGSGYDRGHMAPAGDQNSSQTFKDETFFLSNMAPQVGIGFNRHIWQRLETMARDWVADGVVDSEWIITGPIFYDPAEEEPDTADGLIVHEVIGANAVSAPTHFYKIVVGQSGTGLRAVAFVLENRKYSGATDFHEFIQSIDWIEERTGLNFMPGLDSAEEADLEAAPGGLFQ